MNDDWTFEYQYHDVARRKADWQRRQFPTWGTKTRTEMDEVRVKNCPLCGKPGAAAFRCNNQTLTCDENHMWKTCHICYETTASRDPVVNGPTCKNDCELGSRV